MTVGRPLRATRRRNASTVSYVERASTSSRCTARTTPHVNKRTQYFFRGESQQLSGPHGRDPSQQRALLDSPTPRVTEPWVGYMLRSPGAGMTHTSSSLVWLCDANQTPNKFSEQRKSKWKHQHVSWWNAETVSTGLQNDSWGWE